MSIKIRKGVKKDAWEVYNLIKELAEYENAPDAVVNTFEQFETDGFGAQAAYQLKVAERDGEILGMALFYYGYSTWNGRMLYLDDLVVAQAHLRKGIGKLLLEALFQEAALEGIKLVKWQVLDWNEPAIQFYNRWETKIEGGWLNCTINESRIKTYREGTID